MITTTKPLDFQVVSARVETQLALRRSIGRIKALEENLVVRMPSFQAANHELVAAASRPRKNSNSPPALRRRPSFPRRHPSFRALSSWAYRPCDQLAGDALNVFPLCDDYVGMFVLDVSRHGVAASLLSVAATAVYPAQKSMLLVSPPRPHRRFSRARRMDELFPFNAPPPAVPDALLCDPQCENR